MHSDIGTTVPLNIDRAKRIAKRLCTYFPRQQLATCQSTTAHLLGHKDWHALEEAIKSNAAPGPFNEDLDFDTLERRLKAQHRLLCRELGLIDPDSDDRPPEPPASKPTMTEQELAAHFMASRAQSEQRLEKSHARWTKLYASEVLYLVAPTDKNHPSPGPYVDLLGICTPEQIGALPAQLGQWWDINIAHQPVVGQALKKFSLDANSRASLLQFGHYWGTLCMHYAESIAWDMAMGVAYILANRYGSLIAQDSDEFYQFVTTESPSTEEALEPIIDKLLGIQMVAANRFFNCYPRDDFAKVFRAQPQAFVANAEVVMDILSDPSSRRGTWVERPTQ